MMAPQAGERIEQLLLEGRRRLAVRMRAVGDTDLTTAGPGTAFVRAGEPAEQNRKIDDELRRRLRQIDALVFAIGVMLFAVAAAVTYLYWECARPFVATDDPLLAARHFLIVVRAIAANPPDDVQQGDSPGLHPLGET